MKFVYQYVLTHMQCVMLFTGLCFGIIGDIIQSAKYHQDALRVAIKMQTLYGQSIAVGNLGMVLTYVHGPCVYLYMYICMYHIHIYVNIYKCCIYITS
jgi:hypothetical protein